jgi:hypothetical protein
MADEFSRKEVEGFLSKADGDIFDAVEIMKIEQRDRFLEELGTSLFDTLRADEDFKTSFYVSVREEFVYVDFLQTGLSGPNTVACFQVLMTATSVQCNICDISGDDDDKIEIGTFLRHEWTAGNLGRHLANVCLDLNSKICGIIELGCELPFWNYVSTIVKKYPMSPLVKSAGKI